mmetsp:Transcript_5581/g.11119  ORF Transcript_5581/g.11119 Transcript_5581/m.11119 type:complete len:290 (+) Transcript_5581:1256-2125(+)
MDFTRVRPTNGCNKSMATNRANNMPISPLHPVQVVLLAHFRAPRQVVVVALARLLRPADPTPMPVVWHIVNDRIVMSTTARWQEMPRPSLVPIRRMGHPPWALPLLRHSTTSFDLVAVRQQKRCPPRLRPIWRHRPPCRHPLSFSSLIPRLRQAQRTTTSSRRHPRTLRLHQRLSSLLLRHNRRQPPPRPRPQDMDLRLFNPQCPLRLLLRRPCLHLRLTHRVTRHRHSFPVLPVEMLPLLFPVRPRVRLKLHRLLQTKLPLQLRWRARLLPTRPHLQTRLPCLVLRRR